MALSRITNYIEADGADLNLQSSDTTITASSVLGVINFKAPSEASGTDAILLASKIEAVAEGTFSSSSNATKLSFATASSEAAAEKMALSSGGDLSLVTDSAVLKFGADGDTTLTHTDGTGLTLNSTNKLTFGDAASFIQQSSDGVLRIDGEATIDLNASTAVTVSNDLKLDSDSAVLSFGADSEIQLIHVADDGLILKHIGTGDGKEPSLTFQAGDNDIAQDDLLGSIQFQAPDEGAGTDAVLVAAGIEAVSEGDFSSSSNATKLGFKTGASEAATTKMELTSGGDIKLLTDTGSIFFGADSDIELRHVADQGLTIKAVDTGGNSGLGPILNLSTGDTDIAQANQLGTINFQAPDEGTGTDAILVGASITAIANGAFAADANPTSLLLRTSDSGTNDGGYLEIQNNGNIIALHDTDTNFDISSVATNTVFTLKNQTSGASNCVSMAFATESNNEQYITAVTNSTNNNGALAFSRRESSSRIETMRLASNGSVIIGATDQGTDNSAYFENSGILVIRRDSGSGSSGVGTITTNTTSTAYNTSSDYRLKENVTYDWDATSRLKQLKPARFNWIDDDTNTLLDGFIAHEVSSIVPESITGDKDGTQDIGSVKNSEGKVTQENVPKSVVNDLDDGTWTKTGTENIYQSIDQSKLVPLLVKALQEAVTKIETLETSNADLITRVKTLEDA